MQKAIFAAGCFWGVEAAFMEIEGVASTRVGYTGGKTKNPSYEDVCTGQTGHAEAVEVTFDPKKVSYEQLLDTFWKMHDPRQLNRQGPDVGTQYRTAVFYHNESQKKAAEKSKEKLSKKLNDFIATEIVPAQIFYAAENYHQQYFKKKGGGACHI